MDYTEDERHLRLQQYATARNLDARATLHARFSTKPQAVVDYLSSLHPERLTPPDLSRMREEVAAEIAARGYFHVTIESGLLVGRRAA